jgi:hypothetical protein
MLATFLVKRVLLVYRALDTERKKRCSMVKAGNWENEKDVGVTESRWGVVDREEDNYTCLLLKTKTERSREALQNNKWPNMNEEIELRKLPLITRSQNSEI